MTKEEARRIALTLRKKKNQVISSKKIIDEIISSNLLDKYQNIGIYYPIGNEIDLMPLVHIYQDKSFYLPITREDIDFVKYKINDTLIDGPFKTKEPIGDIANRDEIECFLVPCVAISNHQRIGYGKGYYDRYLKDYKGKIIGICYEDSIFECEMDDYDIKLDILLVG